VECTQDVGGKARMKDTTKKTNVHGRIILKLLLKKQAVASGGPLVTTVFHKILGNSWEAERLAASQKDYAP
jgi:hypothetical protein